MRHFLCARYLFGGAQDVYPLIQYSQLKEWEVYQSYDRKALNSDVTHAANLLNNKLVLLHDLSSHCRDLLRLEALTGQDRIRRRKIDKDDTFTIQAQGIIVITAHNLLLAHDTTTALPRGQWSLKCLNRPDKGKKASLLRW